jgi:hypothetical protein
MVMVLMVFCLGLPKAQATVVYNDGRIHTVNWAIYDTVVVRNSPLSQPTTLNVVPGGVIIYLYVYNSSQVNISGGSIDHFLWARDNSQVSMSSGYIRYYLDGCDSSQVNISGGLIDGDLGAYNYSQVTMSGGLIHNWLEAYDYSLLTIDGSGFNYPYGTLTGSGYLTGTLASGDLINNSFRTYGAGRIVLVPEPATLLLFGLGAVMVRKRRVESIS